MRGQSPHAEGETAVAHLQRAFAKGLWYGIWLHRDTDVESLRDDPAFEELSEPGGSSRLDASLTGTLEVPATLQECLMQSAGTITLTLLLLSTTSTVAQTLVPVQPAAICIWSSRLPSCRAFLVIEAHARYRVTSSADGQSRFYLTGALGWMRNLDESMAIGVSGFGGYDWDSEITRGGVKARYRRWLGGPHRVDLSAGGFLTSAEEGGVGVVAGIEYGFADALLFTAELDYAPVERHLAYDWRCIPETDYSECLLDRATSPTLFLGFGLGRKWGAASFLVAGCLGVLAAGMK